MSDLKLPKLDKDQPEQRLMLAFGLMIAVLGVTTYFMPKQPDPPPPAQKAAETSAEQKPAPEPAAAVPAKPQPGPAGKPVAKAVARIEGTREESFGIETELFRVSFSNRGAVVRSWSLRKFKDSHGKDLELMNPKAVGKYGFPFQFRFHENQSAELLNGALYQGSMSSDRLGVTFEYFDGTWYGKKTIRFQPSSYVVAVTSEVRVAAVGKPHLLAWRGGFGDFTVIGAAAAQKNVYGENNRLVIKTADTAEKGPQANRGNFEFAGIADSYFAAVALPDGREFELHTFEDKAKNSIDDKEDPFPGMAVGGSPKNEFRLFVGPKDTGLLSGVSPKLPNLVDFGYFWLVAEPLFKSLRWLHDNWVRNWGWTIVAFTILINFALLPLKISSLKSMKQMSNLQPEMKKIQEKYAGMSMKDPRKQNQNQELMDLYKKHGVNPVGGCMPMFLQLPFFIAFYNVLANAIELRGAEWLWVTDLSRPENWFGDLRILPIAMLVTQFMMQKMTPSTSMDPSQQRMMLLMPLMLGFMFWGQSSGLVLYWLTSNVVGIVQQYFFNKLGHAPAPARAVTKSVTKEK
jgi:YidC/Oxa1 family membrane protein insertase